MSTDTGKQFLAPEWLRNKINRAEAQAFHSLFQFVSGADEYDGNTATFLASLQLPTNPKSVHARHADIQQDQIGHFRLNGFEGQLPLIGRSHLIPGTS
jgi:hypothetical protein